MISFLNFCSLFSSISPNVYTLCTNLQLLKPQLFRKGFKSTEERRLTTAQQRDPAGESADATLGSVTGRLAHKPWDMVFSLHTAQACLHSSAVSHFGCCSIHSKEGSGNNSNGSFLRVKVVKSCSGVWKGCGTMEVF